MILCPLLSSVAAYRVRPAPKRAMRGICTRILRNRLAGRVDLSCAPLISERFRECLPDGTEGPILQLERTDGSPAPRFHPVSRLPLRRLMECDPRTS